MVGHYYLLQTWDEMFCTVLLTYVSDYWQKYAYSNVSKMQCKLRVAFGLNLPWYGSMEWNVEENFSMEWKIFSMEWKWNGRKFPEWNMEKSSFIPFHTIPCLPELFAVFQ